MNLLLTGGTGFIGRALLRRHLKSAEREASEIVVLSRRPEQFLAAYPELAGHRSVTLEKGDVQQRDSLPWNRNFTHVLHAATDSTTGPGIAPLARYDQIVNGTRNILDLAVSTGAHRFLMTSSGAVYGPQPAELNAIPEDWPGSPSLFDTDAAYGQGKRAAEYTCTLYRDRYGIETVIARCFAFLGPDLPLDAHYAIGNFIRDALERDVVTVSADGTQVRTYLDQSNLAEWIFALLMHGRGGQAYNVGSDEVISMADLARLVRDIIAPEKQVQTLGRTSTGVARNRYVPDISKVQRDLGLQVTISLAESIRLTSTIHRAGTVVRR